jgi:hypothetical protein
MQERAPVRAMKTHLTGNGSFYQELCAKNSQSMKDTMAIIILSFGAVEQKPWMGRRPKES